ncbi:MAG: YkgJ family cysteine cluster protein [Actinobacteria bacterium]|nr:YkgJ family cysteine cluster protein [Actinomycetota bacterium]
MVSRKWYADGLHFSCQECGTCCSGEPGYVWVSKEELRGIAEFLKISEPELRAKHTRRVGWRISLTEMANGDCTFLVDKTSGRGCAIYQVRPAQCRNWPFWGLNLASQSAWNRAGQRCCGINKGEFHGFEEIEKQRNKRNG